MHKFRLVLGMAPAMIVALSGAAAALEHRALNCILDQNNRVCEALCEETEIAVSGGCRVEPGGTLPVQALIGAGIYEPSRYSCQWAAPRGRGRTTVTTFVYCARRGVLVTPK